MWLRSGIAVAVVELPYAAGAAVKKRKKKDH